MKETGWMITAVTASTTAALALVLVAIVVLYENRGLRQELRSARQQCELASASARQSEDECVSAQEALVAQNKQMTQLETELATHQVRAASNPPAVTLPIRATRVHTYSGGRYLGESWFVPAASTPETAAAGLRPQPMVLLDDSVRALLADSSPRRGDGSESDPARTVHVNYNYNPYPSLVWWPGYGYVGTNCSPTQPAQRPSAPQYPPQPSPFLSTKFYRPAEKPFLPTPSPYPGMTPPSSLRTVRSSAGPVTPITVLPAARQFPLSRGGPSR